MENIDFLSLHATHLHHQRWRYYIFCLIFSFFCMGGGLILQHHLNFLSGKSYAQQNRLIKMIAHTLSEKQNEKKRSTSKVLAIQISILKKMAGALSSNTYLDSLLFKSNRLRLCGQSASFPEVQKFISLLHRQTGIPPPKTLHYDHQGKFILTTILPE